MLLTATDRLRWLIATENSLTEIAVEELGSDALQLMTWAAHDNHPDEWKDYFVTLNHNCLPGLARRTIEIMRTVLGTDINHHRFRGIVIMLEGLVRRIESRPIKVTPLSTALT